MFLTDFPKAALGKQFYLFYDPEALRDSDVSASQGLCTDSERRRAGSQGTKVSMAETHSRASLGWFLQMSAHMETPEQAQCTEHYLHSCSTCNTLFNRRNKTVPFISDYYWKSCFALCSQQCRRFPKALSFWLQALSDLLKGCASLTCGLFSCLSHSSSVPYPIVFSSTKPIKGHFYLLPCISFLPVSTHLPNNSVWGLARINLFFIFYLCLSVSLGSAEPALCCRMRQSLQPNSHEQPLLLHCWGRGAPAGKSKGSGPSLHTDCCPLLLTARAQSTSSTGSTLGLQLPHVC